MKILIKIIKLVFIVVLGVSLSYILTSCKNDSFAQTGTISVDIINVEPSVQITGSNYNSSTINSISGLAERTNAFARAYAGMVTPSLKESMEELIGITIDNLDGNGKNFVECLGAINLAKEKDFIPCFVESAKFEGKDSWIISFAGNDAKEKADGPAIYAVEKSTGKILFGKA